MDLSQEDLNRLLKYEPDNGKLFWLPRLDAKAWNNRYADKEASYTSKDGYQIITLFSKNYKAHRIVWSLSHGPIPKGFQIDHINRDKSDNRLCNLRLATAKDNNRNRPKSTRNTSGAKGVCWMKGRNKWRSRIIVDGKPKYLGFYDDFQQAVDAYEVAAEKYFGNFAFHLS